VHVIRSDAVADCACSTPIYLDISFGQVQVHSRPPHPAQGMMVDSVVANSNMSQHNDDVKS